MASPNEVPKTENKRPLDIDELKQTITRELKYYSSFQAKQDPGAKSCMIYKVPYYICEDNRQPYGPTTLSIGPYHHGTPSTVTMEKEKKACLVFVLEQNPKRSLQDFLDAIIEIEGEVRRCYSEPIKMDSKEFAYMLLLDGCFVLVSLLGINAIDQGIVSQKIADDGSDEDEGTYVNYVAYDLLLLENQIPFFVVKKIYELVTGNPLRTRFLSRIARYIETILSKYPKAIPKFNRPKDFHHLLHLSHMYFRPSQKYQTVRNSGSEVVRCPFMNIVYFLFRCLNMMRKVSTNENLIEQPIQLQQAMKYHVAGVQFKKKEYDENNRHSLLDITFENSVIEIPVLHIDEKTGVFLRNLVAFEQSCPQFGCYVISYVTFMSQLICTPDDVQFLIRRRIITHNMRSNEEVSNLFKRINKDVVMYDLVDDNYLRPICVRMEEHYQWYMNKWTTQIRNYFSNPCSVISLFAVTVLLVSVVVPTAISFLYYLKLAKTTLMVAFRPQMAPI